jgi:hypothetical protein
VHGHAAVGFVGNVGYSFLIANIANKKKGNSLVTDCVRRFVGNVGYVGGRFKSLRLNMLNF